MKKIALFFSVIALLTACNNQQATTTDETTELAQNESTFIALKDIQTEGVNFIDQEIQTKGLVDHVCKHGGKKILLVDDGVDIHVFNDERFEEEIVGKEITVTGVVKEDRIDEAYLLKLEEDAINSHSEGEDAEEKQEKMIVFINMMRDSLSNAGVDHFSELYLQFVSYEETKE
jgi:hypothetical protein